MMKRATSSATILLLLQLICAAWAASAQSASGDGWEQSFKAGMIDKSTGKPIRGTEIVHLVAHKGRLYAGNGYWMDTRGSENIPWSEVLVLNSPDGTWKVDLALGPKHLRVTALKSVTFATDAEGKALAAPVNLLLAASDIHAGTRQSNIWTRNDQNGTWVKTILPAGQQLIHNLLRPGGTALHWRYHEDVFGPGLVANSGRHTGFIANTQWHGNIAVSLKLYFA